MRSMVRSHLVAASVGLGLSGLLGTACVDLFHGTDFPDECTVDADTPGCGDASTRSDASSDAGVDSGPGVSIAEGDPLCTGNATLAATRVNDACAWLSACGGALGVNVPGACMAAARAVYDCRVAPERPTIGAAGTFWRCVANAANARSCDAITACINPTTNVACKAGTGYLFCDGVDDPTSRLACDPTLGLAGVENCSATGRGCANINGTGTCSASADGTCTVSTCTGTVLHACDDAGADQGVDCANFGAGSCNSDGDGGPLGCQTAGATCTATSDVTCDDAGVAHGCPAGTAETVDCTALTGVSSPSACSAPADSAGTTWDVSRACVLAESTCIETCANGTVSACVLGQPATLDCIAAGVDGCQFTTVEGISRATCSAP